MRELECNYIVALPDGWKQHGEGIYGSDSPWAWLSISSQILPDGSTSDQFSQFVQDDLQKDWWPTASIFEITSAEEGQTDGQPTRHIRYRVQESPKYCVLDVEESVVVAQLLPGNPQGFRIRAWMCEHDVTNHGQMREQILESFQISTRPAEYYKQFMSVRG